MSGTRGRRPNYSQKGKDMTTVRLGYYLDIDHHDESIVDIMCDDWSIYMCSFKIKQSRIKTV